MKIKLKRTIGKDGAQYGLRAGAVLEVETGPGTENVRSPGEVWVKCPRVPAAAKGWNTLYQQIARKDYTIQKEGESTSESESPPSLNIGEGLSLELS